MEQLDGLKGSLVDELTRLKAQPGQNLLMFGSAELVNGLLRERLLDELRLLVYPVVLGGGKRLFNSGPTVPLEVAGAKTFSSGVVLLTYRPAPSA